MRKKIIKEDLNRKIEIGFYTIDVEIINLLKKEIKDENYNLFPIKTLEDYNTYCIDLVPDLIVTNDNTFILIDKLSNKILQLDPYLIKNNPKKYIQIIKTESYKNYLKQLGHMLELQIKNQQTNEFVQNLVNIYPLKNELLKEHTIRVATYSKLLARNLNQSIEKITTEALLHDIDKILTTSNLTLTKEEIIEIIIPNNLEQLKENIIAEYDNLELEELNIEISIIKLANYFDKLLDQYSFKDGVNKLNKMLKYGTKNISNKKVLKSLIEVLNQSGQIFDNYNTNLINIYNDNY